MGKSVPYPVPSPVLSILRKGVFGTVKLDRDGGLGVAQVARNLDRHDNLTRNNLTRSALRRPVESAQYICGQFQRLMDDNCITYSMSWPGKVWGDAAIKSVFSSLKTQRITRKPTDVLPVFGPLIT